MTDYPDMHSCSFHCHRPACTLAQRDQLWELVQKIYNAVNEIEPGNRWTFEQVMAYAIDKLKEQKDAGQHPHHQPSP